MWLHGWYCMLNTIRVAAVMHVTRMEWKRNAYTLLVVKEVSESRRNLEDPDVDGIIILNGSYKLYERRGCGYPAVTVGFYSADCGCGERGTTTAECNTQTTMV